MSSTVVNKVPYDFYSMEFDIAAGGQSIGIIEGVDEIEYTVTFNREKLHGSSRKPIDRTTGDIELDASITFLRSWYDLIVAKAKEANVALADLEMTITINFAHKGEVLHTDTLAQAKFAEIGNSHSRGPDPLMVTCPLDIMNVYFDGVDVFGATL